MPNLVVMEDSELEGVTLPRGELPLPVHPPLWLGQLLNKVPSAIQTAFSAQQKIGKL